MIPLGMLKYVNAYFGIFLTGAGINGLLNPTHMGQLFGVKDVSNEMAVFIPAFGGRTLAAGVALWWMILAGHRRAIGIFMTSWAIAGIADTYLLLSYKGEVDSVWIHIMNTCILLVGGVSQLHS
ncbi:hypothetical protein V2G26_018211 [Clonostachys chloroleuca]